MHSVDVAYCYTYSGMVCLSFGNICDLYKNGWTDRRVVWYVDSGEPKKRCVRDSPYKGATEELRAYWHLWDYLLCNVQPKVSLSHLRSISNVTMSWTRMCFVGMTIRLFPMLGVRSAPKTPLLQAWICIFEPNMYSIKTVILSKIVHRFQPDFAQE